MLGISCKRNKKYPVGGAVVSEAEAAPPRQLHVRVPKRGFTTCQIKKRGNKSNKCVLELLESRGHFFFRVKNQRARFHLVEPGILRHHRLEHRSIQVVILEAHVSEVSRPRQKLVERRRRQTLQPERAVHGE